MGKLSPLEEQIIGRVRQARKKADLTQEQLAAQLTMSDKGYSHYEQKRGPIRLELLFQISRLLHVPIEELLGLPLPGDITEEQRWLLNAWRELSDQERYSVKVLIRGYLEKPTS
jgi:transcriptional regulator with XRE-family HTH domain